MMPQLSWPAVKMAQSGDGMQPKVVGAWSKVINRPSLMTVKQIYTARMIDLPKRAMRLIERIS